MEIIGPDGDRWELAIELLRSGEAEVFCRGVSLWRSTAGPQADGRIQVSILTNLPAPSPERRIQEIASGREVVATLVAADGRLGALLDEFGSEWSYVHDYGNGRVLLEALLDQ